MGGLSTGLCLHYSITAVVLEVRVWARYTNRISNGMTSGMTNGTSNSLSNSIAAVSLYHYNSSITTLYHSITTVSLYHSKIVSTLREEQVWKLRSTRGRHRRSILGADF